MGQSSWFTGTNVYITLLSENANILISQLWSRWIQFIRNICTTQCAFKFYLIHRNSLWRAQLCWRYCYIGCDTASAGAYVRDICYAESEHLGTKRILTREWDNSNHAVLNSTSCNTSPMSVPIIASAWRRQSHHYSDPQIIIVDEQCKKSTHAIRFDTLPPSLAQNIAPADWWCYHYIFICPRLWSCPIRNNFANTVSPHFLSFLSHTRSSNKKL